MDEIVTTNATTSGAGQKQHRTPLLGLLDALPPRWLGLVIWGVIFGGTCLVVGYLYFQAAGIQKDKVETLIRELSETAATLIDVAQHEQLQDPSQMNSDTYKAVLAPLIRMHQKLPQAQYLYTMRVSDDDKLAIVLDTTADDGIRRAQEDLGRHIVPSPLLEAYQLPYTPEKNAALLRSLRAGESYVDPTPFSDEYGQFVSGHAPLLTSAGKFVGFIGIDYNVDEYTHELTTLRRYGYLALLLSFLVSGVLARFCFQLRQQVSSHLESARNARALAEAATKAKSELLAIASHDLKNPLSNIAAMASLLLSDGESARLGRDQQRECLNNIKESAGHMAALVRRILDHEKFAADSFRPHFKAFDLTKVLRLLLAMNTLIAEKKHQQLIPRLPAELTVYGDVNLLVEALDNYIGNAIKFTPMRRKIWITLTTYPGSEWVELAVEDEGPGLTEQDLENVFGEFQRLSARPTASEQTTGLGLAIVRKIAELHGGTVGCSNREEGGARFWMRMPIAQRTTVLE